MQNTSCSIESSIEKQMKLKKIQPNLIVEWLVPSGDEANIDRLK